MSDEQVKEDVKEEAQEEVQQPQPPAEQPPQDTQTLQMPTLDCGYVVGLDTQGRFVFEPLGNNQGLVQMLGLHEYAGGRINTAKEVNQGTGYPLLAQQTHQLTEMVKVILNMLTQQQKSSIITPK